MRDDEARRDAERDAERRRAAEEYRTLPGIDIQHVKDEQGRDIGARILGIGRGIPRQEE